MGHSEGLAFSFRNHFTIKLDDAAEACQFEMAGTQETRELIPTVIVDMFPNPLVDMHSWGVTRRCHLFWCAILF